MFDAVRYINLDHRTERKEQIEGELRRMGIDNFERFPAIKNDSGMVGCLESHLNILKDAREKKLKSILVVEDDFEFLIPKEEFWKLIDSVKDVDYDVIMLGANRPASRTSDFNETLLKVEFAMTTSAYLVNSKFYDTLIPVLEACLPKLIETKQQGLYAIDVCWATLQPTSKWYLFKTKIGKQRASYSNIEKGQVNYQTGGIAVMRGGHRRSRKKTKKLSKKQRRHKKGLNVSLPR